MKLERVDWLKCYDDWTYYSNKPFAFRAGKTSNGESCEYQCFIYVSYDLSGVGVAKGAKFYLNDTPCKLDWEKKFFWTETMTAEDTTVQEDPGQGGRQRHDHALRQRYGQEGRGSDLCHPTEQRLRRVQGAG